MQDLKDIQWLNYPGTSLAQKGFEYITEKNCVLSSLEWKRLELLTDQTVLPYTKINVGDTQEDLSLSVFRIKKPQEAEIHHSELMNILGSPKMLAFYRSICNNKHLIIDRCQAHIYETGDFISKHIDRESYQGYLYSLLFSLSEDFSGGEMVLYDIKGGSPETCKIPPRTILFADSGVPHEVLPVTSGCRKTIALFLMEPSG